MLPSDGAGDSERAMAARSLRGGPLSSQAARARSNLNSSGRLLQAACYWPKTTDPWPHPAGLADDYSSPSAGRLPLATCYRPPTTDRLLLAACY